MIGDSVEENGYYNTLQVNTNINIDDLHTVIAEKSAGETSTFLMEYKVSYCRKMSRTNAFSM
jgi:hypothetical protein